MNGSRITQEDVHKNPQAVLDVLEFYSLPDGNHRLFDYGKLNDENFVNNEMQSLNYPKPRNYHRLEMREIRDSLPAATNNSHVSKKPITYERKPLRQLEESSMPKSINNRLDRVTAPNRTDDRILEKLCKKLLNRSIGVKWRTNFALHEAEKNWARCIWKRISCTE